MISDERWFEGFSVINQAFAWCLSFLRDVFQGFVSLFNNYPLLTYSLAVIGICIFLLYGADFFVDIISDNRDTMDNSSVHLSKKHKLKISKKKKNKEKYPNSNGYNGQELADLFFERYPNKRTFSFAGKTYYNTNLFDRWLHNPFRKNKKNNVVSSVDDDVFMDFIPVQVRKFNDVTISGSNPSISIPYDDD